MRPPREQITWSNVVETVFLVELDLLKDTRQDVRQLKWADPSHREAALTHFQMKRAREEIRRLNVEIRRLLTAMYDEHIDYLRAICSMVLRFPALAFELRRRWMFADRVNASVANRLFKASQLRGFSGQMTTGCRVGKTSDMPSFFPLPSWGCVSANVSEEEME